jgi:hypothetical protein
LCIINLLGEKGGREREKEKVEVYRVEKDVDGYLEKCQSIKVVLYV